MAAGDAPSTLSELRTDFLEGLKEVTSSSAIQTIANRYLNKALQDIHMERWWWAERRSTIRTIPPYTTGTVDVAITNLTTRRTVTGTSTLWTTTNTFGDANAVAGYKITLAGDGIVYLVGTVGGATSITLDSTTPYTGASALDDAGYAIYQDEYAVAADFDDVVDVRFFDEDRKIQLIGPQEFYRRYPRNSVRSSPKYATLIELGPSATVALRRRVLFGPAPDKTYIIPYRFYTTNLATSTTGGAQAGMSATGDEPIIPIRFRQAVVYKAHELWYSDRKDDTRSGEAKARYETLMLRARAAKSATEDRPRILSPALRYIRRAQRPYTNIPPRFSGVQFDQMEE